MKMGRSQGTTISVKVPIKYMSMTDRTQQRLRQMVGRDTRVIHAFLGVIEEHEDELLKGKKGTRIHAGELDKLTMTAIKVKERYEQRLTVPHDMKERFPRISQNELTECRQTAVQMYESYLELRNKNGRRASRPCRRLSSSRRIPRWVFSQRFRLIENDTRAARWWLDLRDSLDSVPEGRRVHDRLLIPLNVSPFHTNQFSRGEIKALQIFTDRQGRWWVTFAVRIDKPETPADDLPAAVLGIDLGIEKAACTSLVTAEKVRKTKYFVQEEKVERIKELDDLVAQLQHEMHSRKNTGKPHDEVTTRLRKLKGKRYRVAKEYDRFMVRQILDYITELSERYTLYVAIGRLKNIRYTARRGNYRGRRFRGMIHSWAFARITESLKHNLEQLGWPVDGKDARFRAVPESWTSIMCWKCGNKGRRPRQDRFICPTCGNRCNADRNGAINIAGRLITLTSSLHDVRGLGKWASAVARRARPKARGKFSTSRRKSLLSKQGTSSSSGESAAVHHVQMDLLSYGDKAEVGDHDHAVVRTVEDLTVAGSDDPG
ncbi:MAG: zinc ribbon domain-containing protein [Promethearchaeia archaeon]